MLIHVLLALLAFATFRLMQYCPTQKTFTIKNYKLKQQNISMLAQLALLFFVLAVCVVSSLRDVTVGLDLPNYANFFSAIKNGALTQTQAFQKYDFLYVVLNILIATLPTSTSVGFSILLFIIEFIFIISFIRFIKTYSPDIPLSAFLVFTMGIYAQSLNIVRQMLATCILLYSINCIIQKKPWAFVISVLLATLFHKTAIIFLPIYFIRFIKFNTITIIIGLILFTIIGIFFQDILQVLSSIIGKDYYNNFVASGVFERIPSKWEVLWVIGMLACLILAFVLYKKYANKQTQYAQNFSCFLWLFFLNICLRTMAIFACMPAFVGRFAIYFFTAIIILVPMTIKIIPSHKCRKVINVIVFVFAIVYMIILLGIQKSCGVIPFNFII